MSSIDETFVCKRYSTRLTRGRCASMHAACTPKPRKTQHRPEGEPVSLTGCRHCEVGEAHSKGKAHASAPAVPAPDVHASVLSRPRPKRLCLGCGNPLPAHRRHACNQSCAAEAGKSYESASSLRSGYR